MENYLNFIIYINNIIVQRTFSNQYWYFLGIGQKWYILGNGQNDTF